MSKLEPALLREIGEAIAGPNWQGDVARRLGISDRALRYWMAEERGIPDGLPADLAAAIDVKIKELQALRARLRKTA